ncbi:hypothetical protein DFJ74DRAFT_697879 [Hyaloraphidium curvatum]|nr:hypothetical protein DFJ74DRAFT_697879 [Hyaloraphidium curvatum]
MTTPLSSIPASTACGPCSNPPGANETCGQANAMNGYIIGAPLEPVANTQPATTCMGFGSTGPTGVDNTWGGRLQINTGNPSINDARSCNAFCSQTSGNTHSSMVQIGGQLGCVCAKLNSTDLSSMTASSACAACEVIPPRIPAPVLGTCGMENAQNGAISALALVPVSGTSPSPIVPTPTATSTGSVGQTSAATTASASATATTSAPAQSTTSRPNGAGRTAAGMGAAVALVFAALL